MPSSKTPAKPKASAKAEKSTKPAVEFVDPGEAAYELFLPRLNKIAVSRLASPRTDVRAAASFVLSVIVPRISDRELRVRFLTLPAAEFDHGALSDLEPAAQAVLWTQTKLAQFEATLPGMRLPLPLLDGATALRARMLQVCDYHFLENPALMQEVDDIRSGQGYLDLAEDLQRLGALYVAQEPTLKQDLRHYRPDDVKDASAMAQRIVSELRGPQSRAARDAAWRAWVFLSDCYAEVLRAAHFLLRDAGPIQFPLLNTTGRKPRRHKLKPPPPAPADPK